jgi:hypothetical protein
MTIETQAGLTLHLQEKGLDPIEAVWGTLLDITYLMPTFIEKGGTYSNAIRRGYSYPSAIMEVAYNNKRLLLRREIRDGYPVIQITEPDNVTDPSKPWAIYHVHPDHLDTALCYLLSVDSANDSGGVPDHGT